MEGIIGLHNFISTFLIVVVIFTGVLAYCIYYVFFQQVWEPNSKAELAFRYSILKNLSRTHGTFLEVIWTIIPSIILLVIALPSFSLLYAMDEVIAPRVTLKVIGYQWYWAYEYSDYNRKLSTAFVNNSSEGKVSGIHFDAYMVPEGDLKIGDLRLLEVTREIILPQNTHVRILLTSNDVLHSWAVPAFGVKTDAVPGRLSQIPAFIKREGVFYGQCSELCGVNHGFMPIKVQSTQLMEYVNWVNAQLLPVVGANVEKNLVVVDRNELYNILIQDVLNPKPRSLLLPYSWLGGLARMDGQKFVFYNPKSLTFSRQFFELSEKLENSKSSEVADSENKK